MHQPKITFYKTAIHDWRAWVTISIVVGDGACLHVCVMLVDWVKMCLPRGGSNYAHRHWRDSFLFKVPPNDGLSNPSNNLSSLCTSFYIMHGIRREGISSRIRGTDRWSASPPHAARLFVRINARQHYIILQAPWYIRIRRISNNRTNIK